MKKLIIYLFFMGCLASFHNSDSMTINGRSIHTTNKAGIADIIPQPEFKQIQTDTLVLDFGCYYKLDDKYSQSEDTTVINTWWQKKLREFEFKGIANNIFTNQGGGPNGAEWNSSADIFVVATINASLKNDRIELELNKKRMSGIKFLKYTPQGKTGTIVYFTLPKAVWEKHLRKINSRDFKGIYGKENPDILKKTVSNIIENR